MSERRKERMIIAQAVEQFLSEDFKDGDVVSHHWIHTYLQIPDPDAPPHELDREKRRRLLLAEAQRVQFLLLSRVEDFKKVLLEEHRIALESIRGTGYRVVPPNEQAAFAVAEAAKMISKGIERGMTVLDFARFEEMDRESHKRHIDAQVKMAGLRAVMTREKRDVFALFGPADVDKDEGKED